MVVEMGVWRYVDPDPDIKPVSCQFVFRRKMNHLGKADKHSVKFVIRGDRMKPE